MGALADGSTLAVRCPMSTPDPIDVQVGARLRALRKMRKLSQSDLASALGLSFQQVQKYENGTNRISASKLWQAAELLGVQVVDLFGEAPADGTERPLYGLLAAPGASELLTAWVNVKNRDQRNAVIALVRALGESSRRSGAEEAPAVGGKDHLQEV